MSIEKEDSNMSVDADLDVFAEELDLSNENWVNDEL